MPLKRYWHYLLLPPAAFLLIASFRRFPFSELKHLLYSFGFSSLFLLILYELSAWVLMGERWRYFCRENAEPVPPITANAARLAGFAWSYITPGPHVGGEPAQVLYLHRRRFSAAFTLAALVRDRGYELFSGLFTASFLILIPGSNHGSGWISALAAVLFLTAAVLPVYSSTAFRILTIAIFSVSGTSQKRRYRIYRFLMNLFHPPGRRLRSVSVRILLLLSLFLAPLLAVGELGIFFHLSGFPPGWRSVLVLAAVSRITHYAPVPGALGVYDAGMITAAVWLDLNPVAVAAYVVFTRLRDLIQVGIGMVLFYLPPGGTHDN